MTTSAMAYFWVALGGALGSTARYGVARVAGRFGDGSFPWSTLIVNGTGSLLIGFLAGLALSPDRPFLSSDARAFLLVGVLGGFTTFSSFSLETLNLMRGGSWFNAAGNVIGSVVLCLAAVWVGHACGAAFAR